jgi:hypothetical protein
VSRTLDEVVEASLVKRPDYRTVTTLENYGDENMKKWYVETSLEEVKYRVLDLFVSGRIPD